MNDLKKIWRETDSERWKVEENHSRDYVSFKPICGISTVMFGIWNPMTKWGFYRKPKRQGIMDKIRGISLEGRIESDLETYRNAWGKWCDNENDKLDYEIEYKKENEKFPYNE